MRKTLPLQSLLQKVQKKELLQLSDLLDWSEAAGALTKKELAKKAERDIRNLGSTAIGNIFRLGDPITYRELLDDLYDELLKEIKKLNKELYDELYDSVNDEPNEELYEKHKARPFGKRTIQNMEGAIALRFLEELLQNVKKLPPKVQHNLKDGFNKAGYDTPKKLLDMISSESNDAWNVILGGGVGGGIIGGMLIVNPFFGGLAAISAVAGALGLGVDLVKARGVVSYIFILRQKYDPTAKWRSTSKSKVDLQSSPFKIALIGRVSSGKSATINAIFGAKATKVSPIPGSTTNVKAFQVSNNMVLYDTPGLEDSRNPKYSENAVMFAKESDVILFIVNAQQVTDAQKRTFDELKRWDLPYLVVLNKLDTIRDNRETFAEQIRKKLGCEKKYYINGALNPRSVSDWDTTEILLEKVNWIIKAKRNRIGFNREVLQIMKKGLGQMSTVSKAEERQKLAAIMNRLGIAQN